MKTRFREPLWRTVLYMLAPGFMRRRELTVRYLVYATWPGETEARPVGVWTCLGPKTWHDVLHTPGAVPRVVERIERIAPGATTMIVRVAPAEQIRLEQEPTPVVSWL